MEILSGGNAVTTERFGFRISNAEGWILNVERWPNHMPHARTFTVHLSFRPFYPGFCPLWSMAHYICGLAGETEPNRKTKEERKEKAK